MATGVCELTAGYYTMSRSVEDGPRDKSRLVPFLALPGIVVIESVKREFVEQIDEEPNVRRLGNPARRRRTAGVGW
jgi:hypothetical protein